MADREREADEFYAALAPDDIGEQEMRVLRQSCAVLDGTDAALLDWISASGIAAIAADNYAVEERRQALPDERGGAPLTVDVS